MKPTKDNLKHNTQVGSRRMADEQYYNDRFELWLKLNSPNVNDESDKNTLREIFNAMDDEDK